MPGVVIAYNNT